MLPAALRSGQRNIAVAHQRKILRDENRLGERIRTRRNSNGLALVRGIFDRRDQLIRTVDQNVVCLIDRDRAARRHVARRRRDRSSACGNCRHNAVRNGGDCAVVCAPFYRVRAVRGLDGRRERLRFPDRQVERFGAERDARCGYLLFRLLIARRKRRQRKRERRAENAQATAFFFMFYTS